MFIKPSIGKLTELSGNQGFTLIETMIAMTILTIGMLSVAGLQVRSTQGNTSANRSTRGFIWCSDRIEVLKNLPYTDPALTGTPGKQGYSLPKTADGIDNDYDGQIDEAGEDGDIDLLYTVEDDVVEPNTKKIEVTVTWQSGGKSLTLTTVRARNDAL
jgi:prepilin-type N-terminal cleavage/methylation domain-containing protein